MPKVSVCILSFNRKDKLFHVIHHLLSGATSLEGGLQIVVVDNGSTDGTIDMLGHFGPAVELIRNHGNVGIGGWNQAFERAKSEYVYLADDDCTTSCETLLKAISQLESDPRNAVVALRPINPETGLDFHNAYPTGVLSFWGCCALVRRSAIREVGGLYDSTFFFQAFELDLSMRLRRAGWKISFASELLGLHYTGVDYTPSPTKFYFSRRNLILVATKHFSGMTRLRILRRLIALTLHNGKGYPWKVKGKAILTGILRGLRPKSAKLPQELQQEYLHHFGEFQPVTLQPSLWQSRDFWLNRPQQYPQCYDAPGFSGCRAAVARTLGADRGDLPRLLCLTHRFNTDGATLMVLKALEQPEFRAQFSSITVTSNYEGPQRFAFEQLGCKTEILPFELLSHHHASHLWSSLGFELATQMRAHDRIWINTIDHPVRLLEIADEVGIQGLLFAHESLAEDAPVLHHVSCDQTKRTVLARIAKRGQLAVCWPSTSTVNHAKKALHCEQIYRLPYGIDRDASPSLSRYQEMDEVSFLVTGWFCYRKNQRIMLPVLKRLSALTAGSSRFLPWRVTFAGTHLSNREYQDFMNECLQEIPAERLAFHGMKDNSEVLQLMRDHHYVVIPSLGEALCVSALEMMSTGGLVMSSDCEGSEDMIEDGQNGFIAARNDFATLIEQMLSVLRIDGEFVNGRSMKMAMAAYASTAKFSLENYLARLSAVILTQSDPMQIAACSGDSATELASSSAGTLVTQFHAR